MELIVDGRSRHHEKNLLNSTASLHITYCDRGEIWGWYVDDLLGYMYF